MTRRAQELTIRSKVPTRLTVALEAMGDLGEAVGQHDGRRVLAFGGIPGETAVVEVLLQRQDSLWGQVVELLKPSPHRVRPPCPYFSACTGCQWQHIAYQHQLELKRQQVQECLQRVPHLAGVPVLATVPSPLVWEYRNHARFTVGPQGAVGFVHRRLRRFVRVDRCLIMGEGINQALAGLQGRCGETTQLSVRWGMNTGDLLVQPHLYHPQLPTLSGQSHYRERLANRVFTIASPSFFQVNTPQAEAMVRLIRERLALTRDTVLVDAYTGVGTFAALLAPEVQRVIAIEESAAAVRDARRNTEGLDNVEMRLGKVEAALDQLEERPHAVILDPPRTGCHPQALEALMRLRPQQVAYVSCDPKALVRDLALLVQGPYRVEEVQPIDMFPHTYHIECLATLRLRERPPALPPLVLASASPRRKEILGYLAHPFQVVPPELSEGELAGPPEALARVLAEAKARTVARRVNQGLVVAADTLVALEGRALGKPRDAQEARAMLAALRGQTHRVVTGVAVLDPAGGRVLSEHRVSEVTMRSYSDQEIEAYVASGEPMDKAGAYAVQDPVFRPVARVKGCYLNVVGLPLCTLARMLLQAGLPAAMRQGVQLPKECLQEPACSLRQVERA